VKWLARRNMSCKILSRTTRVSAVSTTANTISSGDMQQLTRRNLAEMLLRIRYESKTTIQKSWNDVECLQMNCANFVKSNAQLKVQLKKTQGTKEVWRARCLAAEEAIVHEVDQRRLHHLCGIASSRDSVYSNSGGSLPEIQEDSPNINPKIIMLAEKKILSHSNVTPPPLQKIVQLQSSTCPPDNTVMILSQQKHIQSTSTNDQSTQSMQLCVGEEKKSKDFFLKISSRDKVISSLEQTLHEHLKSIQALHVKMECLVNAHRIRERIISEDYIRKEERQKELVTSLRKEAEKSDLCLAQREQSLSDNRDYIEELTSELENVLKIVNTRRRASLK